MDERGVTLQINGESLELPEVPAHVGNSGFDISALRATTRSVTFDPGFANTASAQSTITYIDGTEGKLTHRGYAIEGSENLSTWENHGEITANRPDMEVEVLEVELGEFGLELCGGQAGIDEGPEHHVARGAGDAVEVSGFHEGELSLDRIVCANTAAPNPLSILTTATPDAQDESMALRAVCPPWATP